MRRTIRIRLIGSLGILLIGLAIVSTATAQQAGSAVTSQTIRVADDCETQLRVASERLSKALDAYEKATAALNAATGEIQARIALDSLKDQLIAVKDMIIKAQDDLIKQYQKGSVKSKLKKFLEAVEKIALFAAGVYIGHL